MKEKRKERVLHVARARAITQRFSQEIWQRFPHVLCCSGGDGVRELFARSADSGRDEVSLIK